jgi:hypothetical protein
MTIVKNSAQAASYGLPVGTSVAIAVPSWVDPQSQVNDWGTTWFNGPVPFLYYWRPGGPQDYKRRDPKYDAYGNFGFGATGAAAGYSCKFLTDLGDDAHSGLNNQINTNDILNGYNTIKIGGTLSIVDWTPPAPSAH